MSDPKLQEYMDQIVTSFSEAQNEIADALRRISIQLEHGGEVQQIQLLALRRYVIKGGHGVALAWPWNAKQRTQHGADTQAMNAAASQTIVNFGLQNPELVLDRSHVRDLPSQVRLWCQNDKVHRAARHLLPLALKELRNEESYPETPTAAEPIKLFKKFLHDYHPVPQVTSAAPGTSDHGQDRAVDFIIKKNGVIIAGTSTATDKKAHKNRITLDWEETGYTEALKKATERTGLDGPLAEPYEPWHYWLHRDQPAKSKKGHRH